MRVLLTGAAGFIGSAIDALPDPEGCTCSSWAEGIELTYDVPFQSGVSDR